MGRLCGVSLHHHSDIPFMKKRILVALLAIFCMNHLLAQDKDAFEKEVEGIWTVQKTTLAPNKKQPNAQTIADLHQEASYNLSVDEVGLNLTINFKDGTSFSGISLTELNGANEALLNISWKVGTDKKLLKKYGLTDMLLVEKPTQQDGKFYLKLSIVEKKNARLMTFDMVM